MIINGTLPIKQPRFFLIQAWHYCELGRSPILFWERCVHQPQDCLLANDLAIEVCRRFVDRDLNRCFSRSTLHTKCTADSYEMHRAQEINARIGPRFSAEASDLCIDLHNTTSNFGSGIIITDTSSPDLHWKLQLCDYLRCSLTLACVSSLRLVY